MLAFSPFKGVTARQTFHQVSHMKVKALTMLIPLLLTGCQSLSIKPPLSVTLDEQISASGTAPDASRHGMSSYTAFNKALKAAVNGPSNITHSALLEEGMHLVTASCMRYLTRLGQADQNIGFARKETALAGTLAASTLGLAGASAKTIANTASVFGFTTATQDNFSDSYLFSPDIAALQALVLSVMESHLAQGRELIRQASAPSAAMATTPSLSYSEVNQFLIVMESACQPHGIRGLVTRVVAGNKAIPAPSEATGPASAAVPTAKPSPAPAQSTLAGPRSQSFRIVPIQ